ncbi:SCO3933 family regulatory protein [Streptomyces platensis]|uniref:SCO3933 family regulatory protein n=1 Tax=Streptomyces platensis TaxID=58346 RepID=UPI003402E18D
MARTSIRVGMTDETQLMAGGLPVAKWTDQEKGERAVDRETGSPLYTVMIFLMEGERAEALKVTVPQKGLPDGLKPGMPIRTVDLMANPWANLFNGQVSSGVAYRARALELGGSAE